MEGGYETVHKLSIDAIFNYLEQSLTQISRSHHYLLNISEKVRHTDIVSLKYFE